MKKKKEPCEFTQGFACACAIVGFIEGTSAAQSLLKEGGFNKKSLIDAGVVDFDMERIYGDSWGKKVKGKK